MTAEAAAHANAQVPSISQRCRNLPPEVDAVFQRGLAKDPAERNPSAAAFVAALRDALAARVAGAPSPRRSVLLPALLLASAAAIGALAAVLVAGGGNDKAAERVITRRVTGPAGRVTTVHETVTRQQTVTATPPAPPPPAPPVTGSDGHALNDQGYRLIQQGDFAGAVPLLQQAVRKLAGTGPADLYEGYVNYNLGYALYRSGRCSEAIPYLQRAQQLEPDRSEPGNVLRARGAVS